MKIINEHNETIGRAPDYLKRDTLTFSNQYGTGLEVINESGPFIRIEIYKNTEKRHTKQTFQIRKEELNHLIEFLQDIK